jgi:hypothetical protein
VRLRELDDKVVPRAAQRAGALADRLGLGRSRVVEAARSLDLRDLTRLDDRYATSGPLALLRDLPQVGFVLIGVVFLAGAGLAVSRENARDRRADQNTVGPLTPGATDVPAAAAPSSGRLGPAAGDAVEDYRRKAATALDAAASSSEQAARVALVSFGAYRTPAEVTTMLSGFTVQRVYLRAARAGEEAAQLPVSVEADLPADLSKAYARITQERLQEQQNFKSLAASVTVTTKQDQDYKDQYVAFAKTTGIEASEYKSGCACVYAAVVSATPAELRSLRSRPEVRAVEVAGADAALPELQVLPLLPEVKTVVPEQRAGQG